MLIERIEAGALRQVRLDPYWTKITLPSRTHTLMALESRGVRVEIGSFVSEKERRKVASELRRELRVSISLVR